MTIELAPVFRVREPDTYRAAIRIEGAEFVNAAGARARAVQPIALTLTMTMPQ